LRLERFSAPCETDLRLLVISIISARISQVPFQFPRKDTLGITVEVIPKLKVKPEGRAPLLRRALAVGLLCLLLPGCAQDREWWHRQEAVESTIGHDPNKMPAGKVIPPAGLGVDLSGRLPVDRGALGA